MSLHKRRRKKHGTIFLGLKDTRGGVRKYDNGMEVRRLCSFVAVSVQCVYDVQAVHVWRLCGVWQRRERRRRRSAGASIESG